MTGQTLSYEELEARLADAKSALQAIRNEQVDAVISDKNVYLMHLKEIEGALHQSKEKLAVQVLQSRQLATELEESERKHRELIQYAAAGIYEVDFRTMKFTSVNDAMCYLLGYTREEFLAMNPADLTDEKGRENFAKRTTQWLKGEKPAGHVEYKIKTKDGRQLDVVLYLTYTVDEAGRPFGATVIAQDITSRKKAARALKKAYDNLELRVEDRTKELEKKNTSLEQEIQKNVYFQLQLEEERGKLISAYRQRDFLSRQLVDFLERDRREIGSALHDQIGQMLTGISIRLEDLRDMCAKEGCSHGFQLASVQDLLREVMNQTRNISRHLRPEVLEKFGLILAVKDFIDEMQKYSDARIYFYTKGINDDFKDGVIDLVIYRIIQESLNNALKYADATEIFVNLNRREDLIYLTIEDNGVGFDYEKLSKKSYSVDHSPLGLSIMRERAFMTGGAFRIDSFPGRGTCIQTEIPLTETGGREPSTDARSKS